MALVLLLPAVLVAAGVARLVLRDARCVKEAHALAGLFGEPARNEVVDGRAPTVLRSAERSLRLASFRERLSVHAWKGTVLRLDPASDGRTAWTFGDGRVWHVRQRTKVPASLRRCIVFRATEIPDGMGVAVYTPRSCSEVMLDLWDAEELTPDLRTERVG